MKSTAKMAMAVNRLMYVRVTVRNGSLFGNGELSALLTDETSAVMLRELQDTTNRQRKRVPERTREQWSASTVSTSTPGSTMVVYSSRNEVMRFEVDHLWI